MYLNGLGSMNGCFFFGFFSTWSSKDTLDILSSSPGSESSFVSLLASPLFFGFGGRSLRKISITIILGGITIMLDWIPIIMPVRLSLKLPR